MGKLDGLDPRMRAALEALIRASGGRVQIGEGFRSEAAQRKMFLDRYKPGPGPHQVTWNGVIYHQVKGPAAAPPGASMHEIGMAADLVGDLNWVQQHAAEFGLKTFANVNGEPWHVQLAAFPNSRREYEAQGGRSSGGSFPDNSAAWGNAHQGAFTTWLHGQDPGKQQQIIDWLKADKPLGDVAAYLGDVNTPYDVKQYITDYLSQLPKDQQRAAVNSLAVGTPGSTPDGPPAQPSPELLQLLRGMGVDYTGAAQPTPALMAFLNGVGLNVQTAADLKMRAIQRIGATATDAMSDIDRTAGRTKQNITGDLVRRGILSSGESNTRYARQAEDVGAARRDVQRNKSQSIESAEDVYTQARDTARRQVIDRVVSTEEQQATSTAASRAQQDSYRKLLEQSDVNYARQQAAQQDALRAQERQIQSYANQGTVV